MGETMKLWILRPKQNLPKEDNPWEPWFDKAFGFVVCARNEQAARQLAHADAGDENGRNFFNPKRANTPDPWLSENYSTCVVLTASDKEEIIIKDFQGA